MFTCFCFFLLIILHFESNSGCIFKLQRLHRKLDRDRCLLLISPFSTLLPGTLGWLSAANEFRLLPASFSHSTPACGLRQNLIFFYYSRTGTYSKYVRTRALWFSAATQQPGLTFRFSEGEDFQDMKRWRSASEGRLTATSVFFKG